MQSRKLFTLAAALMLAGVVSAAVVSEKPVAVKNAAFSELKDGAPVGWSKAGGFKVAAGKEGTTTFVTLKAEKDFGYPNINQVVLQAKDLPALKEGESYQLVLTYRQKSEGVEKRAFGGIGLFAKGKRVAYVDGKSIPGTSKDWQNVSATLKLSKLPEGSDVVRACFFLNGAGSVSFTDVKFTVKVVNSAK